MHPIQLLALLALSGSGADKTPPGVLEEENDSTNPTNASLEHRIAELERRAQSAAADEWKVKKFPPLEIADASGDFRVRLGGRIEVDANFSKVEGAYDQVDGVEFRRARLSLDGLIYGNIAFKAEYDFTALSSALKDVYISMLDLLPFGELKVGHFKEPFSLEEQTSSNYITFIERSLMNTFSPGRNVGIGTGGGFADERGTFGVGLFHPSDDGGTGVGAGDWSATGRVTFAPIRNEEDEQLVHLGAAFTHQAAPDDVLRYRSRPEAHLMNRPIDTGDIAAEDAQILGLEAAYVGGPLSFQGEYAQTSVDAISQSDPDFGGFYVEASYFLTGESRPYEKGVFGRVKPEHNWGSEEGFGALQLALRFSHLDLDDTTAFQQTMDDVTVGVNWLLNPYTKIGVNYVNSTFEDEATGADDNADILLLRFHVDF